MPTQMQGSDLHDVYEDVVIEFMDDLKTSEPSVATNSQKMTTTNQCEDVKEAQQSSDGEKLTAENNRDMAMKDNASKVEADSDDIEPGRDSVSSVESGYQVTKDNSNDRKSPGKSTKAQSTEGPRALRASADQHEANKLKPKSVRGNSKRASKSRKGVILEKAKSLPELKPKNAEISAAKPCEQSTPDEHLIIEPKDVDVNDEEPPNGTGSICTDEESNDTEEHSMDQEKFQIPSADVEKIEEMESRIEKLEEELMETAALEIALYLVVAEHGSSAHKVHAPARRLSRLYIHACKHWSRPRRGTIAKSAVSGIVLIAKACGNDVPRLTFWLSNTIVLRVIISQALSSSQCPSLAGRMKEANGNGRRGEGKAISLHWKGSNSRQMKKIGFSQEVDEWEETSTFTSALEKIESWIFCRIVESVWWQTLAPHMQPPNQNPKKSKDSTWSQECSMEDQQQGIFSIDLWKIAFEDAFQRLCPVRAGGHECGCLPVLAKMVMEQCLARLDVAMFNAILRESANEIPTDPVSDPILDAKVLPIPAGDLCFGSGARLKNAIGNWSRLLSDLFGMDTDDSHVKDEISSEDDDRRGGGEAAKVFHLLNALSDLLMLPKDMLIDSGVRKEVCPNISLQLVTRILCNFCPDEFCPDPVPPTLLEELNSECFLQTRASDKELISVFPSTAAPVVYQSPSLACVAEKAADVVAQTSLVRNASIIQRKGHGSDEELDELDDPMTSLIDNAPCSPTAGNVKMNDAQPLSKSCMRYKLLREVWSAGL